MLCGREPVKCSLFWRKRYDSGQQVRYEWLIFTFSSGQLSETSVGNEDIEHVIRELSALGLCESVYESAFIEFDFILRQQIVPRFWKHFESVPDPDTGFYNFQLAVHELYSDFSRAQEVLRRLTLFRQVCRLKNQEKVAKSEEATFDELFRSVLLSQLAANFNDIVYAFYKVSFRIFANSYDNNGNMSTTVEENEILNALLCL